MPSKTPILRTEKGHSSELLRPGRVQGESAAIEEYTDPERFELKQASSVISDRLYFQVKPIQTVALVIQKRA